MWGLSLSTLKVGDEVAIARPGSWHTHSEGVYTVVKANKMVVVVQRKSDGYERTFSVKRGVEKGNESRYHTPYLESVESMQKREAANALERDKRHAWKQAESAAQQKDLTSLKEIVAQLEALGV
jgi:hypothetical protein